MWPILSVASRPTELTRLRHFLGCVSGVVVSSAFEAAFDEALDAAFKSAFGVALSAAFSTTFGTVFGATLSVAFDDFDSFGAELPRVWYLTEEGGGVGEKGR